MNALFATPVPVYRIDDAERINAAILEEIAQRRASEQGMVRSNRAGWHSDLDFFARKEPAHKELAQAIMQCIADATRRIAPPGQNLDNLNLNCDGWVNVNPTGGYNVPHDHPGAFWSAAYYVKVPVGPKEGPGGSIEFIDSRSAPTGQGLINSPWMRGLFTMRPEPGTLVIFPSNFKHWVHPNDSEEERVTIAVNAKIVIDHTKMQQAKKQAALESNRTFKAADKADA
jgi:uncharacterized protein (TIGR02466 family)